MYAATIAAHTPTADRDGARRRLVSRRRVHPESVLAPVAVFVVAALLLVAVAAAPTVSGASSTAATRRVRVAASDTLWSIARAHPVEGMTAAQIVAEMQRLNHLETVAAIQPGTVISIPAGESYSSNLAMR